MALLLRVPLAALVLLAAVLAVVAPAPSERARRIWGRPAFAAAVTLGIWTAVSAELHLGVTPMLGLVGAAVLLALATWLHRGRDDDRRDPPDETAPDTPPPEVDWDDFSRDLDAWAAKRERARQRVR